MRVRWMFGLCLLAGCGGPTPATTPPATSAPTPVASSVPPPPLEGPVTVLVPLDETPGKEPFLEPGNDVAKTYRSRTKIVKRGKRWATKDATTPAHQDEPEAMFHEAIVADRTPSRVRAVCVSPNARVATWIDNGDLATVAKVPVIVAPKVTAGNDPKTPGIHLAAGTIVERKGTEDPARVRLKTDTIDGAGLVGSTSIDVVFEPSSDMSPAPEYDGEIPKAATFLDAPNGGVVAKVAKPPGNGDAFLVSALGPPQGGFRLVRYESHDDMSPAVVGWVKQAELKMFPHPQPGGLGLRGIGAGGSPYPRKMVKVTKGMRFLDVASGTPVGVVTADTASFFCIERCEASDAIVAVPACAGTLHVRVAR